jgi:hypothetical protein
MALLEGGGGGGGSPRDYKRPDPGDTGGDGSPCSSLEFECALGSPVPEQLKQIKVNWVIDVKRWVFKGVPAPVAVIDEKLVGTILSAEAVQLLECLENGYKFKAHILEIHGGSCRVRVIPNPT